MSAPERVGSAVPGHPAAGWLAHVALVALAAAAATGVLAVTPYRSFDLDRFFVPKELALHAAALVAGVCAVASARRLSLTRADAALVAWLALSTVSALLAPNHWLAYRALTVSVSGAVLFWSARFVASAGLGGILVRLLALCALAGALSALAQAYGVKMQIAALNRAPGGTFGNRNFMAHVTAASVPLLAWCVANARRRATTLFWAAAIAACAAALVLSRTRAAWLSLAVIAALTALVALTGPALVESGSTKRRLTTAAAAAVCGVLLALTLPNSLDWRSDSPYLDSARGVVDFHTGSGRGRMDQYLNSAHMAAAHPLLGVGAGNWSVIYPKFARPNDPSFVEGTGMTANPWPSSDWVAALAERGVPATLALIAFVVLLVSAGLRVRYDRSRSPAERLAGLAGAGVVLIVALEGAFDAVLLLPTPTIVVWVAVGALLAPGLQHEWLAIVLARRLKVAVPLVVFTLLACAYSERRLQAMELYEKGTPSAIEAALDKDPGSYRIQMRAAEYFESRGQCSKARARAMSARDLFPLAPAPRHVLAQCRQ